MLENTVKSLNVIVKYFSETKVIHIIFFLLTLNEQTIAFYLIYLTPVAYKLRPRFPKNAGHVLVF